LTHPTWHGSAPLTYRVHSAAGETMRAMSLAGTPYSRATSSTVIPYVVKARMRPWADVGIFHAMRQASLRRCVSTEPAGTSGLLADTSLIGTALKIRGFRGASGSIGAGDAAPGTVTASAGAARDFGLKSASAACRAWLCWRSGVGSVNSRRSRNLLLQMGWRTRYRETPAISLQG
jgi:hypothetical protein